MRRYPQEHQKHKEDSALQKAGEHIEEGIQHDVQQVKREVNHSKVPWYRAIKRAHVLIGVYAVLLILFGLLAWFVHVHPVDAIDVAITRNFQQDQAPWLRYSMLAVSYLGFIPGLMPGLVILAGLIFWLVRLRLEAILVLALSAVSYALETGIKLIVARPRPSARLIEVLYKVGGQSFPSGHVMSYVAFWGLIFSLGVILLKRDRWWHYALLIIPALLVILVGPSRIYLGDHWASDVLGGYLISGVLLGISLWIYLKLKEKGVLASKKWRRKKTY